MRSAYKTPEIALTDRRPEDLDADLLIFPVFESSSAADASVDEACDGTLSRARTSGEFKGKLYDTFIAPITAPGWKTRRAMFVGAGRTADWTSDRLRRIATTAGLLSRQRHIARIAFVPGDAKIPAPVAAQVIAEGACLANFDGGAYKTNDDPWGWLEHV